MRKFTHILGVFLFAILNLLAQGQEYFQQLVEYDINVTLDDQEHELSAFETITYHNNSPDTLTFIYFHLWPNAYKNNKTALAKQLLENGNTEFYYATPKEKGHIDSLDFRVDGQPINWEIDSKHIDIAKIDLNNPLLPGEKITISTPFNIKIPKGGFSRLGHLGESYQITQWYPKPAVYDKDGWHPIPYLDQGEFYSEYGSYDVKITLPKNYVVGATGDLVDGEKETGWLNQKEEETKKIIEAGYFEDWHKDGMDFPESDEELKTLHYHQKNVHDFAWFADKRYYVLKGEITLPHSGNTVTTWAMFTANEGNLWQNSIEYLNDAVYYYSLWNGDYPYSHVTAVDGTYGTNGGMEYPNVTIIGESGDAFGLETIIMHEVGHNWFYGILGSNERIHPWMDEGLNSLNENRYVETKYPNQRVYGDSIVSKLYSFIGIDKYYHKHQYYLGYLLFERENNDQPIEFPSAEYTEMNYYTIVYGKSALAFDYLMAYLGQDLFDSCMQEYYATWKFRHPQPEDLQFIFEQKTGKDLSWFFDDVIKTTRSIDYKIVNKKGNNIKIKNTGEITAPFSLSAMKNGQILTTQWYDGFDKTGTVNFPELEYDKLKIDAQNDIPEINRNNNTIKSKGILKKAEPLTLQLLGSLDDPDKNQLFFTPIIGTNTADRFMFGIALYNNLLPQKKFEYILAPMYSLGSNTVTGSGIFNYHILTDNKIFNQATLSISGNSYTYQSILGIQKPYYKIEPKITFDLYKQNKRSALSQSITLKGLRINEPEYLAYSTDDYLEKVANQTSVTNYFGIINHLLEYDGTLKQFNTNTDFELHKDFAKLNLEAKLDIPFKDKQKGIHIRAFAGTFLFNTSNNPRYNYRMDGSAGFYDYRFDYMQFDRSGLSNNLSKLLIEDQGGFKVPVSFSSSKWIAALNFKSELPYPVPIGIFADIGTNSTNELLYDAGVYVFIFRNYFEFYIPLVYSTNIKNTLGGKSVPELIRFTLNLNGVNPFKLLKEFEF